MMSSFYQASHSLFIQAPPEKIFEVLTDWTKRAVWRKGIDLEWEGGSKAFLNQKVTFKVWGLIPYSFSFHVMGLEPSRRLFLEYTGSPLKGRHAWEITPEENGCQVAFHWMKVEPGGFLARLYFGLGFGMWTHQARTLETLRMLKQYLEKPS